jgi:hypothetical protein
MKKPAMTTAFLLLLVGAAYADFPDMPPMKEGLWKIRMIDTTSGQKLTDTTYSLCRDHTWDQHVRQMAQKMLTSCTTTSDVKSGNTRTVVTSCKISNSTVVSKSTLTSSSDTNYHTETFATFTPPLFGQSQDSMIQDQTFMGACPTGMQPGDRQLADGTIQHHR